MRKIMAILLIFLFAFYSIAFALVDVDKESQYKWNKLDLVSGKKTVIVGGRYGAVGSYSEEEWYMTKGGKQISEVEYLRIIGDEKRATEIEGSISIWDWVYRSAVVFVIGGLAYVLFNKDSNAPNTGYGLAGAGLLIGSSVSAFKPSHYLKYEEVGPKVDEYNNKLKKELGVE